MFKWAIVATYSTVKGSRQSIFHMVWGPLSKREAEMYHKNKNFTLAGSTLLKVDLCHMEEAGKLEFK